nr:MULTISPECIES: hypothetical protein [Alphaproteobacteria]
MKFCVTSEALEIIEDDDEFAVLLGIEIGQHGAHAWALHEVTTARSVIREYRLYGITFHLGVLSAPMLLTDEASTLCLLARRGYTAIDKCTDWRAFLVLVVLF